MNAKSLTLSLLNEEPLSVEDLTLNRGTTWVQESRVVFKVGHLQLIQLLLTYCEGDLKQIPAHEASAGRDGVGTHVASNVLVESDIG